MTDTGRPGEPEPRPLIPVVPLFYLGMVGVAWLLSVIFGEPLRLLSSPGSKSLLLAIGAGTAVALLVIVVTRVFVRTTWGRELERAFGRLLGPMTRGDIALIAIFSGAGEELLFRGAIQPQLGFPATSILFGLVHVGPGRAFVPWMFFALGVGFLLGGLFLVTGGLLASILAHVAINWVNLGRIRKDECRFPGSERSSVDRR